MTQPSIALWKLGKECFDEISDSLDEPTEFKFDVDAMLADLPGVRKALSPGKRTSKSVACYKPLSSTKKSSKKTCKIPVTPKKCLPRTSSSTRASKLSETCDVQKTIRVKCSTPPRIQLSILHANLFLLEEGKARKAEKLAKKKAEEDRLRAEAEAGVKRKARSKVAARKNAILQCCTPKKGKYFRRIRSPLVISPPRVVIENIEHHIDDVSERDFFGSLGLIGNRTDHSYAKKRSAEDKAPAKVEYRDHDRDAMEIECLLTRIEAIASSMDL